jgi:hypothetical protein
MTITRLRQLLDAYGANPAHWPPEERDAACALITHSAEAQHYRDTGAQLDAALDLAVAQEPSPALLERILAATPQPDNFATLTLERLNRPARPSAPGKAQPRVRPWRYVSTALPLAAAAALVLWLLHETAQPPEPAGITVAEIGVFEAPTDVLLSAPGIEALDSVPSFGCTSSWLGCLDTQLLNQQSTQHWETYA